jgi:hypothetical protein
MKNNILDTSLLASNAKRSHAIHRRVCALKYALPLSLLSLLLFVTITSNAFAQQSGCGTNPFQDWYWIDPTRPFTTVTGTISRTINLNTGDPWDDGDWNIYVVPDDGSVLKNRAGQANSNGEIEFEINTRGRPSDLANHFPVGSRIEGYGEWVEDTGHDNKTELHPLYWMRTLNKNPITLFMGQDDTGRCVDAQNLLWEGFEFPIPAQYPIVRPGAIPPSNTQIFHESAKIACGTTKAYVSPNGYVLWVYLDSWWFSDCESVGRVIHGDSPYYFGTIERSTASLLKETLTYSVATEVGTGQKIAFLKVEAELDSPPQGNLVYSKWEYESSAGAIIGTVGEIRNQPPHKLAFSMPYAPALGYNQNKWRLSVSASTKSYGVEQPQSSSEFAQEVERTLVTEGRTYALDTSEISFKRTEKEGGVCPDAVYLTIDQSKLLPQIALRSIRWYAKILRDADGYTVSNPVEVLVTPQAPLDDVGFLAQTYNATYNDPDRDKRFDVIWKQLSSGQPNLAQIAVAARGVTELGEQVEATELLSSLCGIAPFSYHQIMDYSYRLLASKGLRGELYKVIKKVSRSDKKWLEALARFSKGEKISEREKRIILSKAREGSRLPAMPSKKKPKKVDMTKQSRPSPTPIVIPLRKGQ